MPAPCPRHRSHRFQGRVAGPVAAFAWRRRRRPGARPRPSLALDLLGLPAWRTTPASTCATPAASAALQSRFQPEIVFHLAAQPLVRRGYRDPVATFATMSRALVHLLEAVRRCPSVRSSSTRRPTRCYEPRDRRGYREDDPLGGHDPYSTSKACAELVSDCYRRSYFGGDGGGRACATARAGNVVGGGDWAEDRLVPDLVRAAISGQRCACAIRGPPGPGSMFWNHCPATFASARPADRRSSRRRVEFRSDSGCGADCR